MLEHTYAHMHTPKPCMYSISDACTPNMHMCAKHLQATHTHTRDAQTCQTHIYVCTHTAHALHIHTHRPDMHACTHTQHTSLHTPAALPHIQFTLLVLWSLSDLSSCVFSRSKTSRLTANLWIFFPLKLHVLVYTVLNSGCLTSPSCC